MTSSPYPPDYIKLPPAIACADEEDALIVTMTRILGLCWGQKYKKTSPYTPDQLCVLLNRPRTTLYRHLNKLQQIRWLKVDRQDRRLILQPLIRILDGQPSPEPSKQAGYEFPMTDDKQALREALQEAGIVGRAFREMIQSDVDPLAVRAWYLWTWAKEQEWMDNPAGYIITRLREGDAPPEEFLDLVLLTPEETARLVQAWVHSEQYQGWPSLGGEEKLRRIAPLWAKIRDAMKGY